MSVITRIAPSPTGTLHIGTARSALFNYLLAKQHSGKFILRIEDTDQKRSTNEYEKNIVENLSWLGLTWDLFIRQSENIEQHVQAVETLLSSDTAYLSKEPSKVNPGQLVEVVRLRNPGREITFADMIRGNITVNTGDLGDFVIARTKTEPLYHLAVVVDDHVEGITHIIRGEDHIANTPRQILLQEALGYHRPQYAHLPLILAPDRSKLSKRRGATSIDDFRARGYFPEAIVNYLALLGWNPGTDQEIFSMRDLVEQFKLERVQLGGAIFDEDKLKWINREYLKMVSDQEFYELIIRYIPESITRLPKYNSEQIRKIVPLLKERISTLHDVEELAAKGDLTYYFVAPQYEGRELPWKETSVTETKEHLKYIKNAIIAMQEEDLSLEKLRGCIMGYATEKGRGAVLWPLRYALSGKEQSPDPFVLATILGKGETIQRLSYAEQQLQEIS